MGTTKKKSANAEQPGRFAYEGLERVLHEKARLGIMTSLVTRPEGLLFGDLKRLCALTDGNLSRHLEVLQGGRPGRSLERLREPAATDALPPVTRRPGALRGLPRAAGTGNPGRDAESRTSVGAPPRAPAGIPTGLAQSSVGGRRSAVAVDSHSRASAVTLSLLRGESGTYTAVHFGWRSAGSSDPAAAGLKAAPCNECEFRD